MNLEWFDRVCGELQDSLESVCDKYDQNGEMTVERGAKHPRIDFFIESEDPEREIFCSLYFDPRNEEFYMESVDPELGFLSKVILDDIEDIIDAVHESFHFYMEDDYSEDDVNVEDDFDSDFDETDEENDDLFLEEVDVEWETPEITAYYKEDEVEVTYQFGIVPETGDAILKRVNRVRTEDDDLLKDETNFIFGREEASTIISLIASHM